MALRLFTNLRVIVPVFLEFTDPMLLMEARTQSIFTVPMGTNLLLVTAVGRN